MARSIHLIIIFCLCAVFFCSTQGHAQNVKLNGSVIDSLGAPMIAATVVLVQPEDSVMVSYALTNADGKFVLNAVDAGNYFLQVTYIGYGNYRQTITVKDGPANQNLGAIFLSPKNSLLEEVVVQSEHIPIVMRHDTVEYSADAFKTRPNAAVEDLLKKLPGVQVNRDGSIRAQGEDVENVLVDGKEFFGQDGTIATRNLPAEAVNKVQVFDKKSEMAEFSGIDDGNDEKTINLTLKDDKKSGYFGNVEGGFGHDDIESPEAEMRYRGKASVHRFDEKLQMSLLAMANNNNDPGFSFNDYFNFMGGMGLLMRGGGMGLSLNQSESGIPVGDLDLTGVTETMASGLNFNYAFNENIDWQSSYFINRIDNLTLQNTTSENLGTEQGFSKSEATNRNDLNLNHRFNSTLRLQMDSTSEFTWRNRLAYNTGGIRSDLLVQTNDDTESITNASDNKYEDMGQQFSWNSDFSIRKKFKKPGRIIAANVNVNLGVNALNANVNNLTSIYDNGSPFAEEAVLQDQDSEEDESRYALAASYTEPIGKKTFLSLRSSRSNYSTNRMTDFYDIDPIDPSNRTFNQDLSNHFQTVWTTQDGGLGLRYVGKKLNVSGNVNYQTSNLEGNDYSERLNTDYGFSHILPSLRLDYDLGNNRNLEFNYRTQVQAPSLTQLQPALNNTNPVYTYSGNPNLKPEYTHSANLHFMLFDEFSFTSFFVDLRTSYTLDRIVNASTIDDQFRQFVSPVNTRHNFRSGLYSSFSTPLRFIKSKISIDANLRFNQEIFLLNSEEFDTERWTNNYTVTLENRNKEKIDIAIGTSLGTSSISYPDLEELNQDYFDQSYFTDLIIYLPKNWSFESTFDYTVFSDERFGAMDDRQLWSAKISKSFMEGERLTVSFQVFDILNQNQGIDRTNDLNYVQESRSNVLGRYVMLNFNYKLSDFGHGNGMQIDIRGD